MSELLVIVGVVAGLLGHQSDEIIEGWKMTPRSWKQLTRSGVGVVLVWPIYLMTRRAMGLEASFKDTAAYFMAFVPFGLGAALGHWLDNEKLNGGS